MVVAKTKVDGESTFYGISSTRPGVMTLMTEGRHQKFKAPSALRSRLGRIVGRVRRWFLPLAVRLGLATAANTEHLQNRLDGSDSELEDMKDDVEAIFRCLGDDSSVNKEEKLSLKAAKHLPRTRKHPNESDRLVLACVELPPDAGYRPGPIKIKKIPVVVINPKKKTERIYEMVLMLD